jgi:hypothetical protein
VAAQRIRPPQTSLGGVERDDDIPFNAGRLHQYKENVSVSTRTSSHEMCSVALRNGVSHFGSCRGCETFELMAPQSTDRGTISSNVNNIHEVNIIHDRFGAAVMARSIGSTGRRQSVPQRWMIVVGLDIGPSFVMLIGRLYAGSLSLPRFTRGKQGFSTNFDVEFYRTHKH